MSKRATSRLVGCLVCAALVWTASLAQAYEFSIDLRTIGQGYQVRRYGASGANELLTRRRLTQYLNLNVSDLGPTQWRGDAGDRNVLYFDSSLRFETDFGGYLLSRPGGENEIRELKQSQIDILYAYLGGRNVGGRVDFQLGRQMHFDLVDFYAFDGADVVVRLVRALAVEVFSGTEVRGERPLSAPIFELDGTSAGARDPITRPGQNAVTRPLAGAAVAVGGEGPFHARLAYRRVWSATADRLPGEPATGVNDEKLALTASAALGTRLFVWGGVRYNLLLATSDDQQLAVRLRLPRRQGITLEHSYLAPTFDGDSIWNVFASGAYRDLRAIYELGLGPEIKAYARAFARLFTDYDLGDTGIGGGGSLGAVWRRERRLVRADSYWEDGYGGRKLGVDLLARAQISPAFDLEARLTSYHWRSDLLPSTDVGFIAGAQAGGRWQLGPGLRLHLLAENNLGTTYYSQYRGIAIVEMDASL